MKKKIVILHGWKSSASAFKEPIKLFLEIGYEVHTPDLPGFGKTSLPTSAYSLDDYVRFVLDFTKKRNLDKFILFGHSFGGRVALKFTYRYPDQVLGLVLCGVPALRARVNLKRSLFFVLAKLGGIVFSISPLRFLKNLARTFLYFLVREKDYLEAGLLKETFRKVVSEDLSGYLGRVTPPTLILWGQEDKVTPVVIAHSLVNRIPKAQLVTVESAGHKLPYENPKEFVKHVDTFIQSL